MRRWKSWMFTLLAWSLTASASWASPWSILGLPLVFGQENDVSWLWPNVPPERFQPAINLSLPADLEECQDCCPCLMGPQLAQECLKAWREVWKLGRFDLAPVLANKAVAFDPECLEARHAQVVSELMRMAGGQKPCNGCCSSDGNQVGGGIVGVWRAIQECGSDNCCEGKNTLGSAQWDIHLKPFVWSWFTNNKSAAPKILPVVHVVPMGAAPTKENRVTFSTTTWRAECDRLSMQSNGEIVFEGAVHIRFAQPGMEMTADRVLANPATGAIHADVLSPTR